MQRSVHPPLCLVLLALLAGSLALGCRSKLGVAVGVATERNRALGAPPKREHFFVRDPGSGTPSEEVSGLYRSDGTFIRDGVQREWYSNGALHWERWFERDVPVGVWTRYWKNGGLRFVHEHDPSAATPMVVWHPNGVVAAEGNAIAGLRVGPWTERWPNGALRSTGEWDAGGEAGLWEYFDESGALTARGRYRSGVRIGEWERPEPTETPRPTQDD